MASPATCGRYGPAVADERTVQQLRDDVAAVGAWRHRIDLGRGVVTPGNEDTEAEWRRLQLPARFDGERVLDIGCSDGFYTFTAERLGAAGLLAIDDESSFMAETNGFRLAAEVLGSRADYQARMLESLDPATDGTFDVVLFINVLYHLRNPVEALERIAAVTSPGGLLVLKTYYRTDVRLWVRGRCLGFDLDRRPKWWYFPGSELGGDPTNWWAPNAAGVDALLRSTGWAGVRRIGTWRDRIYFHARRA